MLRRKHANHHQRRISHIRGLFPQGAKGCSNKLQSEHQARLDSILKTYFSVRDELEYYQGFNSITAFMYILYREDLPRLFFFLDALVERNFGEYLTCDFSRIWHDQFNRLNSFVRCEFAALPEDTNLILMCSITQPSCRISVSRGFRTTGSPSLDSTCSGSCSTGCSEVPMPSTKSRTC